VPRSALLVVGTALLLAPPAFAQRAPAGGLADQGRGATGPPAPGPASEQLRSQRVLPLSLALAAAAAAVAACEQQGHRVSAAVVDGGGTLRALLRADGAGPHTVESAARKAYTAASLGAATSRYAEIARTNPAAAGLRDIPGLLLLGGGLPIAAGDERLGGIGVAGAPGADLDERCAQAGVDRLSREP
jgi:uncharacterized protein GlcG (DUF336 family)